MSNRSWQTLLRQTLASRSIAEGPPRVAVVGVGQELHGDDAAGLVLVQELGRHLRVHDGLLLIEAGPSPENVTGALRRFGPAVIILVDAALMGEVPGTVRYLDPLQTDGISASSHTVPLSLVAGFLAGELECAVCLLGIEPAATAFPSPLSRAVCAGITRAADSLAGLLSVKTA